jgi:nitrate reductase assembly molybdenum cofactor insertion protein NarJ
MGYLQDAGGKISSGYDKMGRIPLSYSAEEAKKKAKKASDQSNAAASDLYSQTEEVNKGLTEADTKYSQNFDTKSKNYLYKANHIADEYKSKIGQLDQESKSQAKDATQTYTNDLLPAYKDAMSKAKTNADQAMSLSEASDPNNPIMKQIRELYDQQAKQARDVYGEQGDTVRRQGQADFGVLSALGAQASAGQFGAAPGILTAGQMGQIANANQGQASGAYAKAQQRVYDLQQQGLNRSMDLQSAGLGRSFDQSNHLYDAGQQAQGRYSDTVKDYQGGSGAYYDQQSRFRDEGAGYAGNNMTVDAGLNSDRFNIDMMGGDITKGNAYAGGGREQQALNQKHGVQQQNINNTLQTEMAGQNSQNQMLGGLLSAGATVASAKSDRRSKKNINDISNDQIDEFLSAVKPKSYEYKDASEPGTASGGRLGFMLQDVQKTDLGKKITRRGPDGDLMYDKDNLQGIILAALAKKRVA